MASRLPSLWRVARFFELGTRLAALAVLGLLALSVASPSRVFAQFFPYTVDVEMDDGVELATDVWRNIFDETPRPVLLRRTPYGRQMGGQEIANYLAAGYIVVSQDVRGRGDSQGNFVPFFTDKEDGRATIDWIAKQSWSNGRVGTYSASAEGIVQHMAMAAHPAALTCTHISMATHDLYESFFPGGVWRTEFGSSWLTATEVTPLIDTWKSHEVRDDYWKSSTLSTAEMAKIDHPVFVVGGFFDIFAPSQSRVVEALQKSAAPTSRGDVFFVMGPWTHGGLGNTRQGQLLYPDDAALTSYYSEFIQYLYWCLQDAARPPFANVRYYLTELTDELKLDTVDNQMRLVAKGEWRSGKLWPPAETRGVTLYLGDDGQLTDHSSDAQPVALDVDPANVTPTRGGGNFSAAPGPFDQTEIDARPDVYVASSASFDEAGELVGTPRASIWAASATTDVDVVVRFEDVTPSGRAIVLSDGIRRGRFVSGYDAIKPLTPGVPALFEVELGPIALRVPVGHSIRIAISGASSPRYEPNPNVATKLSDKPTAVKTTLKIFRDAAHPSQIVLPLLAGRVPGARPVVVDAGVARDAGTPTPAVDAAVRPVEDASVRPPLIDAAVVLPEEASVEPPDAAVAPAKKGDDGCAVGAARADGRPYDASSWLTALALLGMGWRRRAPRGGDH